MSVEAEKKMKIRIMRKSFKVNEFNKNVQYSLIRMNFISFLEKRS